MDDEVTITAYRDGPLVVRGAFRVVDHDGVEIDPGRATVALCRCGRSALKPFCDGSHKPARFRSGVSAHRRPGPAGDPAVLRPPRTVPEPEPGTG